MNSRAHGSSHKLDTLLSQEPQKIRAQVVEALLESVSAEVGGFFSTTLGEDGSHYHTNGVYRGDDRELIDQWILAAVDGPAPESPWFSDHAEPTIFDRFVRVRDFYDDDYLFSFEVYRKFFGPAEVGDQLRAVIVDGDRFLGWVGVARRGTNERFSCQEESALQKILSQVKSALTAAQVLSENRCGDEVYAMVTPGGAIECASPNFKRQIDAQAMDLLSQRVRALDEDRCNAPTTAMVGDFALQLVRLDGPGGVRYLARAERAQLMRIDRRLWLTRRQREIAEYAAAGATVSEIADVLDLSPYTVKTHLKNIYCRLGVASRVELAQIFE